MVADKASLWRDVPSPEERSRLTKTLARQATFIAKVKLSRATDIDALTRYWGRGGRGKDESGVGGAGEQAGLAEVIGHAPTPEFAAMMAEECQRLLERLDDPELAALALAKLEGYTNKEIAKRLGCSVRTVERQLRLIRKKWQQEEPP